MKSASVKLDWSKLLGFNHATGIEDARGPVAGIDVGGASANYSIVGLGAKIGSKQWQSYSA